jgi:hypothetical protein
MVRPSGPWCSLATGEATWLAETGQVDELGFGLSTWEILTVPKNQTVSYGFILFGGNFRPYPETKIPLETWRHLPDEIWLDQQWTLGLGFCRKTRCQKPDVERPQPQTEQAVPTSLDFTCHPHTMVSCRWFTQVASSVSPKFCIVRDRWSGNCIRLLFCCKRLGS